MDKTFDYLLDVLKSLPGVGTKQAKQIAYFLLNKDERYIEEFISRIRGVKQNIHFCEKCNNLVEGKYICDICSSSKRNTTKICVISSSEDLNKIEDTKSFDGIYFVLNDEVDLKKGSSINPDTVRKFMTMLKTNKVNEVILANNWTINGEATAAFIKKIINELAPNANVYRLAIGLPINSALDYADNTTLRHAINNKTKY